LNDSEAKDSLDPLIEARVGDGLAIVGEASEGRRGLAGAEAESAHVRREETDVDRVANWNKEYGEKKD
jgi:hypothetical protein